MAPFSNVIDYKGPKLKVAQDKWGKDRNLLKNYQV